MNWLKSNKFKFAGLLVPFVYLYYQQGWFDGDATGMAMIPGVVLAVIGSLIDHLFNRSKKA
jgi:hypothetical protein